MTLKGDAKFEEKLTCGLENDMRNMANFHQSTWKSQNWDFDGILYPKKKTYELKIHRGVMCYDNEEWCKIWRGVNLSFQNWHEEFDEFWHEHLKFSNISILMCSFWAKHILFELKKNRWVFFHETEEGSKIWRGIDLLFKKWHKEFEKFDLSARKSQRFLLWWAPY